MTMPRRVLLFILLLQLTMILLKVAGMAQVSWLMVLLPVGALLGAAVLLVLVAYGLQATRWIRERHRGGSVPR